MGGAALTANKDDYLQATKLLQNLQQCLSKKQFSDVTLVDAEREHSIDCHKVILLSGCEYFQKILDTEQDKNIIQIDVPDWSAVEEVIKYIYGGKLQLEGNNCYNMLQISVKWNMDGLTDILVDYIQDNLSDENVALYHQLASDEKLARLLTATDLYIREHFTSLGPHLSALSASSLAAILRSTEINVPNEDTVFLVVKDWYDDQQQKNDPGVYLLMYSLRFSEMSSDFLQTTVKEHEMMKQSPGKDILQMELLNLQKQKTPHQLQANSPEKKRHSRYWSTKSTKLELHERSSTADEIMTRQLSDKGESTSEKGARHKIFNERGQTTLVVVENDISAYRLESTKKKKAQHFVKFCQIDNQSSKDYYNAQVKTITLLGLGRGSFHDRFVAIQHLIKVVTLQSHTGEEAYLPLSWASGPLCLHATRNYIYGLTGYSFEQYNIRKKVPEWETLAKPIFPPVNNSVLIGDDSHVYMFGYYSSNIPTDHCNCGAYNDTSYTFNAQACLCRKYCPQSGKPLWMPLKYGPQFQIYDIINDTWTLAPQPPDALTSAVIYNGEIVDFTKGTCTIYNISNKKWRRFTHDASTLPIVEARIQATSTVVYNNKVHVLFSIAEFDEQERTYIYKHFIYSYDVHTHTFGNANIDMTQFTGENTKCYAI